MQPTYNLNATWISLGGFLVTILGYFHIVVEYNTVLVIIGGFVALFGVVKQAVDHKKLAVTVGAVKK